MIVELGHFALILALFVATAQAVVPIVGAARRDAAWIAVARPAAVMQFVLIALSFGCLAHAFMVSDFSVLAVVQNSHSTKPLIYKLSGVWGNHEGSMLLWVLILATFGVAVAAFGRNLPPAFRARVLGVQAMISVGFLAFILLTSNPFARALPAPPDGQGLNPILQDPALAIHPPFLYLGYVGFSIAFSFAVAALLEGRVDAAWARWVRPWTLAAWIFLTVGIGLGSWWAYYELGWGGWWYWDPVENASFMPWLAGTALLHSAVVVEKRDALKGWTVFLAIVTFSLSLLGTFLVRSGVLTSVHAFAVDPARGVFILMLLLIVVGGSLALFAARGPALKAGGLFRPISREGGLLLNNLVLATGAAVVLLGTLYPLILDTLQAGKVSVGPPFFNATFVPLMVPMVVAMAVGPFLSWKRADIGPAFAKLWSGLAGAALLAVVVISRGGTDNVAAAFGLGLAAWLGIGTLLELAERVRLGRTPFPEALRRMARVPRASWGMTLGHLGLAIFIAGATASASWKVESIQTMHPGETVELAGFAFTFDGAREVRGPDYTATRGTFTVTRDGETVARLYPERRVYLVRDMPTTEAAIRTTPLGDIYVVVGDPVGPDGHVTRLYYNPLVAWIWAGILLMAGGGLVSLSDRRHRVGAPRRAAAAPAGASA